MSLEIILVEDEFDIADSIKESLVGYGYKVTHIADGDLVLKAIQEGSFSLAIVDITLPNKDGFTILKEIRKSGNNIPVICLSARSELADRLIGFESGADDYVTKPFFIEELILRIQVLINRKNLFFPEIISAGNLSLNRISYKLKWKENSIKLSKRESVLIEFFMKNPDSIFTRQQILKSVWNISSDVETNVVDVYVLRIRKKLENDLGCFLIETIHGIGYKFSLR